MLRFTRKPPDRGAINTSATGLNNAYFFTILNRNKMRDIVWIIIVLLILGWLLGYLSFGAVVGNLIHILLIVAVVLIVLKLLNKL